MRLRYKLVTVLFAGLFSCTLTRSTETYFGGWTEKPIIFLNSISHVDSKDGYFEKLKFYKWGGLDSFLTLQWIKKSENLLSTHQIIKNIGYKKFISDSLFNAPMKFHDDFGGMLNHDWENLSISNIVDSLIYSYNHEKNDSSYFEKFWNRRIAEKNDKILICVLKEIKSIYSQSFKLECNEKNVIVNDTLANLLKYDLQLQEFNGKPTTEFLWTYFDYLKSVGLSHSAYNLVIEEYEGKIKLDTVVKILKLDRIPEDKYWEARNNATWIYSYRDNGP